MNKGLNFDKKYIIIQLQHKKTLNRSKHKVRKTRRMNINITIYTLLHKKNYKSLHIILFNFVINKFFVEIDIKTVLVVSKFYTSTMTFLTNIK